MGTTPLAVVFGTPGTVLTQDQFDFFRDADPLGLILFSRNCESPDQLKRLCARFREAVGRDAPILIDHEGGQHQRMDPPVWPAFPAPAAFGRLYARDPALALELVRLNGNAIGNLLREHGVTVDCAPLLDLPVAGADPVIGERAFGSTPAQVIAMGRAFVDGMRAAGVTPVIKHIPGHGRATVDSHKQLPTVDTPLDELDRTDFAPFRALADAPWGMVAHIVYPAIDPLRPASTSKPVVETLIRKRLGFSGVLISDCIYMDALQGDLAQRCSDVLASGMDIALSSHGDVTDWTKIAAAARPLTHDAQRRLARREIAVETVDVDSAVQAITRQLAA
ncbi:beta-N-acetylhexosaminidase [Roseiterribacter gracilis]|uniref:beta-N-acetylhexosaminidase n=1 Tax=Roseiterribacter gracilis TaxID=2812848 RepID=A0A8S8XBQ0_9PROT|nr:beta-hexosaminidase [Rhodospirillales bacterium TMPK1]